MGIHLRVAQEFRIHRFPAIFQNTVGIDHRPVCDVSPEAIPVLDIVDVEKTYGYSASCYHCRQ